jgi:hypothetical protein
LSGTILLNRLTGMTTKEFALKFDKSTGFTPEDEFTVRIGEGGWGALRRERREQVAGRDDP